MTIVLLIVAVVLIMLGEFSFFIFTIMSTENKTIFFFQTLYLFPAFLNWIRHSVNWKCSELTSLLCSSLTGKCLLYFAFKYNVNSRLFCRCPLSSEDILFYFYFVDITINAGFYEMLFNLLT